MTNTGAKILAIFMIGTMIISSIAFFVGNNNGSSAEEPSPATGPRINQTIDFFDIGGQLINEPFASVEDALRITPPGATTGYFVDVKAISNTPMEQFALTQLPITELNSLYGTNTMQFSLITFNESLMVMSTFEPTIITFDYTPIPYKNYKLLSRQDTSATNVMGNPTIYGSQRDIVNTLDIIDGFNSNTSYNEYEPILTIAPPAEFQWVTNNVTFADQFYFGLKAQENNTYLRTTIYNNPNKTILTKIETLKKDSADRGFTEYNLKKIDENMVLVSIKSTLLNVVQEDYQ